MHSLTLKSKLTLAFVGVILFTALVSIIAVGFITNNRFQKYALASAIQQAESLSRFLEDYYAQTGSWDGIESTLVPIGGVAGRMASQAGMASMMRGMMGTATMMMWMPPTSRTVIADPSGVIIADTEGLLTGNRYPVPRLKTGIAIGSDDDPLGFVFVGAMVDLSLKPLEREYIRSVILAILLIVGVGAIVVFVLSSAFVSRIVTPLRDVMKASREIAAGNFSARITSDRSDEIGSLAESFNVMGASLQKDEQIRIQLIADIAHELRTPLSLIRGNIEAILDDVYPLDKNSIASVHEETLFLAKLVEDLRDLSLLDADELPITRERIDVRELLKRAHRAFEHEAHFAGISFELKPNDAPAIVGVDRDRTHQVLCNLISNAIRHSPLPGTVTIGIDLSSSSHIEIFVADKGPGIIAADRDRIFERFYRTDGSRNRATGGSGLGLAISKKIVEAHNGTIRVEGNDSGSCFVVRLPRID